MGGSACPSTWGGNCRVLLEDLDKAPPPPQAVSQVKWALQGLVQGIARL